MHRVAYKGGVRISLDPTKLVGKGGEAYIYDVGGGEVAKVYKEADDPDFSGEPIQQKLASERIATHQTKLREFPFAKLPSRVVAPKGLLTDANGRNIMGYTMEFLRGVEPLMSFTDRDFRERGGIGNNTMMEAFGDLHLTVSGTHKAGVVIADFNSLNVLMQGKLVRLVDADSMQNSKYLSRLFTVNYVDPRLCNPSLSAPVLYKAHDELSDWYAFTTMLLESLLFVRPWGGVYKPKDAKKKVLQDKRPLLGISIFNPEVGYPKPATPYKVLPDELLDLFYKTFEKKWRGEFPVKLLDIRFGKCPNCGTEHARPVCPNCSTAVIPQKMTQIRGSVRADFAFQTKGIVIFATVQNGELRYIYHENGKFLREDGRVALEGDLDSSIRYRVQGDKTILAKDGKMIVLNDGKVIENMAVDSFGNLPLIDANSKHWYWANGGILYRNEAIGPEVIGNVLEGQTLFWVGEKFGFGFYRAGNLTRAFVFDADRSGINDSVKIIPVKGQLIDSTCVFTSSRAWFMTTEKIGGKIVNRAQVIKYDGEIEATAEAEMGDGSWLGKIRGKLPVGDFVLSATDQGMVRAEIISGKIVQVKEFPDTEPYLDEDSFLLPSTNGVLVVRKHEILNLSIR
ncbi:MAG: hypothetical protein HGB11_11125 [Chlorobiales bacterium]|nr:hypothetical protein [Chlorobiales bacterium]